MSTLKVNAIQGTDGVERYMARAWVNFNGTGTVAIMASGNVSSITDNGVGDYTINLTNAMPDASYAVVASAGTTGAATSQCISVPANAAYLVDRFRIATKNGGNTAIDNSYVNCAVFR